MIRKFYDHEGLNTGGGSEEVFSITDYNRRCAEFLGGLYSESAKAWGFGNPKNIGSKMFHGIMYNNVIQADRFEKELKFHSDWNWIIEVVEAIETTEIQIPEEHKKGFLKNSTHGNIVINTVYDSREEFKGWSSSCSIELEYPFIYDSLSNEPKRFTSKKEAVVQAINQFLIWHNKNK